MIFRSPLLPSTLFCVCVTGVPNLVQDIVVITAIAAKDILIIPSVIVQRYPPDVSDVVDPSYAHRICPDT